MKKLLLLMWIFLIALTGCKKNETSTPVTPPSTGNLLNDNAHLVDTLAISNITPTSININKANTLLRPKIGDILIAPPTSGNSYGLLGKVTSVTESINQINCTVVQSNLNDAFKQLNINYNYLDTFSKSASFRTGSSFSVEFNANNTIANGIGLHGIIKFNIPNTKIEYIKRSGTLFPDKVLIQADFNINESSLEIKNSSNSAINVISEINLITFNLPTIIIPVPIGPILIPVPFTQQIHIKMLPISISARAKWTINPRISATLGGKYENSTFTNLCSYSIDATASPLSPIDFGAAVLVSAMIVKPVYEIKPLGQNLLKAFFEVPNYLELKVQAPNPNYSLKYKLDVTGGFKIKFWTGVEQEYSITGHFVEKTILEGNWTVQTPTLITTNVSSITPTTATSGGNISSDGGAAVTARGVCWSISPNPSIANSKIIDGTGIGIYTSLITGLTPNTTYYVRAYATNSAGIGYGNQLSFTTASNIVTDIDGNIYTTVTIGTQVWMVENLKVTHYRNGNLIPNVTDATQWSNLTTGGWCYYNNDAQYNIPYGKLYNWYTVSDIRNIAPNGWHIPTDADWTVLSTFLGGELVAGTKMKEAGTSHWLQNNFNDNSSGFTALPGGLLFENGIFRDLQSDGYYWSATEDINNINFVWWRSLNYSRGDLFRQSTYKARGVSIRCIKD